MDLPAQGWYKDPYGLHQDRWFSCGLPTKLIRDAGVEGYAEPPDAMPPYGDLAPSDPGPEAPTGSDVHRAGEAPYDKAKAARAVWDVFDRTSHGNGAGL
jgi:hypothetical protein